MWQQVIAPPGTSSATRVRMNDGELSGRLLDDASPRTVAAACSPRLRTAAAAFFGVAAIAALIWVSIAAAQQPQGQPGTAPPQLRVVVNTWWPGAAVAAYGLLSRNFSAVDSAVAGCVDAESRFAYGDHTVGPDGSPDFSGETTLDALLCDGATQDVGAVAYLRNVSSAILAARAVMRFTRHTLLAGDGAAALASQLGGQPISIISGAHDATEMEAWRAGGCQPNYYEPSTALGANASCGPFAPVPAPAPTPLPPALHAGARGGGWPALAAARAAAAPHRRVGWATLDNHDTLGLCALDAAGSLAVGVTSNGANHKVPGRVGDAPLIGAGGYASDESGGCAAATGDGDITQRFLPAFVATENMRNGMNPTAACEDAVRRIMRHVNEFSIGIVCLNARGEWAAAGHGWTFTYCAAAPSTGGEAECRPVPPLQREASATL